MTLVNRFPSHLAFLALIFVLSAVASATAHDSSFANIHIKNFGQMDERFYRGGQPKEADYKALAELGIKTVIDLRKDSETYEQREVEALGMRYVSIPMDDKEYPKLDQVNQFLNLANDPATGKFFVHCAGGRHRTGVMGAAYRFSKYHWNFEQVYAEMKDYDFYTRFGHGKMKDFVEDYWQQIQTKQTAAAVPGTPLH
ncbi:MAG: tyrosine-protein phosphatase [Pyrinomonadaceae bacterium]|jgi:protein tyrosine/serine phosphatase|nr:tyrosine-protein phosphatase [Pyrinomonadaceae bacterium]